MNSAAQTQQATHSNKSRVVIIGGGLAGMSAAEALIRHQPKNFQVTILEAKRRTGGRAGSFSDPVSGESIDYCQHVAMGCCTNFIDLMQRCGLVHQFCSYSQLQFLHPNHPPSLFAPSRWLPPPLHLANTIGALRYLSKQQKRQVRRGLWRLMRTASETLHGQTAAEWLAANGQSPKTISDFWDVILVSALGEQTTAVSMSAARKVLIDGFAAARGASTVLVPTQPLSILFGEQLPRKLINRGVEIKTESPVKTILENKQTVSVELTTGQQIAADHIIAAVPWHRISSLLSGLTANIPVLAALEQCPASPITGIHLWFDRPISEEAHAVMVGTVSQWFFRDPVNQDTGSDEHYCQVVISASHDARHLNKDDLINRVLNELCHAFPAAREANLLRHRIVTDPNAVFSITPKFEAARPNASTALPWLHLAGDWIATGWPATMEGAVISGRLAANSICKQAGQAKIDINPDLPRSWLSRCLIET